MMPYLFETRLFGWEVALPTYGSILALSFLLALWVALRQARRVGVESGIVTDLWILSLISGVLGAKITLYLIDLDYYLANPGAIFRTLLSAGVFYGGLLAAIGVCLIFVRRRGLSTWLVGDILAPAIILGQAAGRWGCFAAGCCYGAPASVPWAVTFTNPKAHDLTGVPLGAPLHPSQVYLSLADLVLFGILLIVASRKKFQGQVFLLYLILYAVLRGTLEMFRGDDRGSIAGLSTSQAISIVVGLTAIVLYVWRARSASRSEIEAERGRAGRPRRKEAPAR